MTDAIVSFITWLRDRPRLLAGLFLLLLGAIVFYDFLAPRHGVHFAGDKVRGFWAMFGLAGAWLMTKFMKWFGHEVLMKPTDFYTKHESGEE